MRRQTERLRKDRRGIIKERADGGHEEDRSEMRDTQGEGGERIREKRLRGHTGGKREKTKEAERDEEKARKREGKRKRGGARGKQQELWATC